MANRYETVIVVDGKERALLLHALALAGSDYLARAADYKDANPVGRQLRKNEELCKALRLRISATEAILTGVDE